MVQITININGDEVDVSQPEPKSSFRKDMDVKKAMDKIALAYIKEASEMAGESYGKRSRVAEILGFPTYQAYTYWEQALKKRAASR